VCNNKYSKLKILAIRGKNDLAEVSKNLAGYKSENILSNYQNNYVLHSN